jgi:hypothetical protein
MPTFSQNAISHPILTKIYCNYLYVGAISTFKRSFHSLLHAKCSARYFQRRNKPTFTQNAIIHQILKKNDHNFLPDRDISTLKRSNCCISRLQRGACCIKRRYNTNISQDAIIRRFLRKMSVISSPLEICRSLIPISLPVTRQM